MTAFYPQMSTEAEERQALLGELEKSSTHTLHEVLLTDSQKGVTLPQDEDSGSPEYSSRDLRTSPLHRYTVLVLISMVVLGDYYCTVSPAGLQDHFLKDLQISVTKYMSFFSNLQWTGIASYLLGGFLVDRIIGNRLGIVLFSFLVGAVHAVFAMGAFLNNYWMMFATRAIYGLVNAPMTISNDNISVKWFKTKGISMVFGLKTSFARVSSVAALNVLRPIYSYFEDFSYGHTCLGLALLSGTFVSLISFFSALILAWIDRKADKMENVIKIEKVETGPVSKETVRVSDVKDFPATYWLIAFTTAVYYMGVIPFVGLGQLYFEKKYELVSNVADNVNSMVFLMGAITLPIFGFLIDRTGKSITWMFIGLLLSIASHGILAFTFLQPYVPMVILGLGYSIVTATMWPMVAYAMDDHLGTAYGIMNSAILIGQAVTAYISGILTDTSGYFILEIFFLGCIIVSLLLGTLLYIADLVKDGYVNLSSGERRLYNEQEKKKLLQKVEATTETGPLAETSAETAT